MIIIDPDPSSFPPPADVESDDDNMAGTKIGIPKFTEQETDISDKAKDWFTGFQTYFTEKGVAAGDWERTCGLIQWSLESESILDRQDPTSASYWFKRIMENYGPGGRVFTSFSDFVTSSRSIGSQGHPWKKRPTSSAG